MQDIRRVLQAAGTRLFVVGMLHTLLWSVTLAMGVLIVLVVADKSLALDLPWLWVYLGALGASVVVGLAWAALTRKRESAVARIVDERAGLRESLSTALCVEHEEDPWSRAVVESASEQARRVIVRDAIPIEAPRTWKLPTATAAVLIATFFLMPPLDLRGARAAEQKAEEAKKAVAEAQSQAQDAEKQIREIMDRTGLKMDEEKPDPEIEADLKKPEAPDQIRKEAIRKLTNVTEQLQKKLESDEAKTLDAMKDMMRQLRSPGEGELTEFARELSRGNFDKARQSLEELSKKLSQGELSPKDKQQLEQQMKNMAEQLQQMAQQQGEIEKMLQQAGISPEQAKQMAANPQAMQQALQNSQQLTDQQKQQLQQMAQAMQQAGAQCQNMSQSMSQMASAMSQDSNGQQGQQGMDAMSSQLSQMEMMQADMQAVSQAMGQCQGQMASLGQCNGSQGWGQGQGQGQGPGPTGQWSQGSAMSQGSGSGGPGHGNGQGPDSQEQEFVFTPEKAKVQNMGGPTIGSRYVFEGQIKGEARAEFAAAVEAAGEQASEQISTMAVDPQYRESVKHYFGRLQERVKAQQAEGVTPPAAGSGAGSGKD
ncbi:MAG: hypothetical protein IPJ41_02560 [Phycisphaerales bacterium]|nr:hypothetical protein [Phycisphaerales bacterium]